MKTRNKRGLGIALKQRRRAWGYPPKITQQPEQSQAEPKAPNHPSTDEGIFPLQTGTGRRSIPLSWHPCFLQRKAKICHLASPVAQSISERCLEHLPVTRDRNPKPSPTAVHEPHLEELTF